MTQATQAREGSPTVEPLTEEEFDEFEAGQAALAAAKKNAVPFKRTKRQVAAVQRAQQAADLAVQESTAKAQAAQLAQIVNLTIAGLTFEEIGASIGASADEIERRLMNDTARYVRTQPALRAYVRQWISGKYLKMIDADWDAAIDVTSAEKLDNQDRVMRMLDRMAKLHGAEMPVQSEVKLDAAPEAVERLVAALAAGQGLGYDTSIFDVVEGEVVHEAAVQTDKALEVSGNRIDDAGEGEPL